MTKSNDDNNRAYFSQRLCAYIIDMIIVLIVSSVLTYPFVISNKSLEKLSENNVKILEKYSKQKIDVKTYYNQSIDNSYQISKVSGLTTVVTIIIYVLYFIVYQFYKGGQTIGKRLMKIKIIKNDDSNLSMNDMVLRNLINNFIIFDIIRAFLVLINKNVFVNGSFILEIIQYIVLFVSIFMVIVRKDGRSVSDFIGNTRVVRVEEK